MSLRTKVTQIAQETATATVGQLLSTQTQGTGTVGFLATITLLSSDGRIATVQDDKGNLLANVTITSNRPLGVGDTVNMLSASLAQ